MDKRQYRWWWQKLTRGFDDTDLWSLDNTIAKFVLPRLREFADGVAGVSIPSDLFHDHPRTAELRWKVTLEWMLQAFEIIAAGLWTIEGPEDHRRAMNKIERGMYVFGKYFLALWY